MYVCTTLTPQLFSSYKPDRILSTRCILCLAFLYTHANSLIMIDVRVFVFSRTLSKLHCCFCVACFCVLVYLAITFSFIHIHDVVGLLVKKFAAVVGVAFIYCINVKPWYTVSIFVIIYMLIFSILA